MSRTKEAGGRTERRAARQKLRKETTAQQGSKSSRLEELNEDNVLSTSTQSEQISTRNITKITGPQSADSISTDLPASTTTNLHRFGDLATSHNISSMNIISSSQIEKKVTAVLQHLSSYPTTPPAVAVLRSKAKVASKAISVVEIAKREITARGGKWFQYSIIEQVLEERGQRPRSLGKGSREQNREGEDEDEDEDENEEESFETMKTPFERAIENKPKVRAVQTMIIFLSRDRIDSLRKKFG